MNLIIGGAHQGKQQYASSVYDISPEMWADGETCSPESVYTTPAICNFHQYIRRCMESGQEISNLPEKIKSKNPDILIVTDEVGYGIVPMDPMERAWREKCGRICTALASYADSVTRVCCGIGQKLK
ncbi:MAG: bifunctional adenosylcobinamide kinase/adenosylcobinamide-phosphate guanylyltransferase [Clostridiales bacterium]|nr:bifunctional adenosylcobinamide kinase/adenosylcobinamide-phosphate guanylyltransferase [Clostridiales bacterium]